MPSKYTGKYIYLMKNASTVTLRLRTSFQTAFSRSMTLAQYYCSTNTAIGNCHNSKNITNCHLYYCPSVMLGALDINVVVGVNIASEIQRKVSGPEHLGEIHLHCSKLT